MYREYVLSLSLSTEQRRHQTLSAIRPDDANDPDSGRDSGPDIPPKTNSLKIDVTKHEKRSSSPPLMRANSDPNASPVPVSSFPLKNRTGLLTTPQTAAHKMTPSHSIQHSISNLSAFDNVQLPIASPEILGVGGSLGTIASEHEIIASNTVRFKPEKPPEIETEIQTPEHHRIISPYSDQSEVKLYSESHDLCQQIDHKLLGGVSPSVYETDIISPSSKSHHGTRLKVELSPSLEENDVARLNSNLSGSTKSSKSSINDHTARLVDQQRSESTPLEVIPSVQGTDDETHITPSPSPVEAKEKEFKEMEHQQEVVGKGLILNNGLPIVEDNVFSEHDRDSTQQSSSMINFANDLIPHMFPRQRSTETQQVCWLSIFESFGVCTVLFVSIGETPKDGEGGYTDE